MGINGWLLFSTKEAPTVISQPGNWPCFPLRLLRLSFKRHHSCHPQLLCSQLATAGPLQKTALLALPTWLTKAICQGLRWCFPGIFRKNHTQLRRLCEGSSEQQGLHSVSQGCCKAKVPWFFTSPRARICLGIRKFSLLLEKKYNIALGTDRILWILS